MTLLCFLCILCIFLSEQFAHFLNDTIHRRREITSQHWIWRALFYNWSWGVIRALTYCIYYSCWWLWNLAPNCRRHAIAQLYPYFVKYVQGMPSELFQKLDGFHSIIRIHLLSKIKPTLGLQKAMLKRNQQPREPRRCATSKLWRKPILEMLNNTSKCIVQWYVFNSTRSLRIW